MINMDEESGFKDNNILIMMLCSIYVMVEIFLMNVFNCVVFNLILVMVFKV